MSGREPDRAVESGRERETERAFDEGRDIEYQRREWRAQRIAWVAMAAVVLAAGLGLLGNAGPLASARSEASDNSIRITFDRLVRHHAPSELTIDVAPEFVEEGEIRLWVDVAYMRAIGLESILPEPESVELEPGRVVYVFSASEPDFPLVITFFYEHDGFWSQRGRLGLVNGTPVAFSQFVFP